MCFSTGLVTLPVVASAKVSCLLPLDIVDGGCFLVTGLSERGVSLGYVPPVLFGFDFCLWCHWLTFESVHWCVWVSLTFEPARGFQFVEC